NARVNRRFRGQDLKVCSTGLRRVAGGAAATAGSQYQGREYGEHAASEGVQRGQFHGRSPLFWARISNFLKISGLRRVIKAQLSLRRKSFPTTPGRAGIVRPKGSAVSGAGEHLHRDRRDALAVGEGCLERDVSRRWSANCVGIATETECAKFQEDAANTARLYPDVETAIARGREEVARAAGKHDASGLS